MMTDVAALFVRHDSIYKTMPDVDAYDKDRNALTFSKSIPVVAHPPCRAWGVLSHMAKPEPGEKRLANWAVSVIRKNGGVLEHPSGSRLFNDELIPLPGMFPDEWGGYSILINQYDFGHVASKPTIIYICGCPPHMLPSLPEPKTTKPLKSITGQVPGTKRCTQYEREYTPPKLTSWMLSVARLAGYFKNWRIDND